MEQDWLKCAFHGGLRLAKPGVYADAVALDMNSMYPFVMTRFSRLPRRAPTFAVLAAIPERFEGAKRPPGLAVYRLSCGTFITTYDVERLREEGEEPELAADGSPNAMEYDAKNLFYFGSSLVPVIKQLYALKSSNCAMVAKRILVTLFGVLGCKKPGNRLPKMIEELGEAPTAPLLVCGKHDRLMPAGDGRTHRLTKWNGFASRAARMAPFIPAAGKLLMTRAMRAVGGTVVYAHTDGMVVVGGDVEAVTLGSGLGEWKIENRGTCEVVNCNRKTWR
jgi:hypothetical protein